MSLEEKIKQDYILAMKARDNMKSSTLSFLRAQLKNVIIDKKKDKLEDAEVMTILKKQIKQRNDSIEQYKIGARIDLVEKEMAELNILKSYLPEEMPESEIKLIVENAVKETSATSIKDMGKVMKAVTEKTAGKADNKIVSELVRNSLLKL